MLVGRTVECAQIDRLLEGARQGESSTLVVRGEPGIGKTALLRYAVEHADGMVLLQTQGVESESELPFAGLSDLLRPLLDRLDRLPAPQAAALSGALAIGPSVAGDRFAVSAATLSLLAVAADDAPVLVLVDDAQWLDGSSAEALAFTARRLRAEGVVLLFGLRDAELTSQAFGALPHLRLSGLGEDDAVRLLAAHQKQVARDVAVELVRATAGNPLALVEVPVLLTARQLSGQEPLERPLPVGETVQRVFLRQVATLAIEARRALLVAAASDAVTVAPIAQAIAALGGGLADLEAAETTGLITLREGQVGFRHPLVRSAVYQGAPAPLRRAAHRALADTLPDEGIEARAWHLAAAAVGPDEEVAGALVAAAANATKRRSYVVAANALERAARLSTTLDSQVRRLAEAADAAQLAGRLDRAMALLDEALASANEQPLRSEIQHQRARILTWRGAPVMARELLVAEAAQIQELEPASAVEMLTSATLACLLTADTAGALEVARQAVRLGRQQVDRAVLIKATLLLVLTLLVIGRMRAAHRLLRDCRAFLEECDPLSTEQLVLIGALCHLGLEDFGEARRLTERAVGAARTASAVGVLPFQLAWLSVIDFRTGHWAAAYAGAHDARRLAEETDWITEIPNALVALAQVEAGQGRVDDCREHATVALGIAQAIGAALLEIRALSVLGLLELGLGQAEAAVEHLEPAVRLAEEHRYREPATFDATTDLVEAYLRANRPDAAAATLPILERHANETRLASVRARAARCHGLLTQDFIPHFEAALAAHADAPVRFDRARTELCFGEALRRSKQRAEARPWLRSALATFEQLGAVPWADRARTELRVTGERTRRRDVSTSWDLTPQELQVALVVAKGATNQAAAARLFLSTKTIEFHLGNIYRKLGIQSRAQLAYQFATEGTPGPAAT
jgi:DNA-binding NarL/FixJ family response regulator